MALNKAIEHGKEKRKPYRHSKSFDRTCRNHGSCGYCEWDRTYNDRKNRSSADIDIKEWEYNK